MELFVKAKEQEELLSFLQLQGGTGGVGGGGGGGGGGSPQDAALQLRALRGAALQAAHAQMRELMAEVERRGEQLRLLEEAVRLMSVNKAAVSEAGEGELERLRQEVALLMGKLRLEGDELHARQSEWAAERQRLERAAQRLRQQRGGLEVELAKAREEAAGLSESMQSLRAQMRAVGVAREEVGEAKAKAVEEAAAWRRRYEDVSEELDALRAQVADVDAVSAGIGRLLQDSEGLDMQRMQAAHEREVGEVKDELEQATRTIAAMRAEMEAAVVARVDEARRADQAAQLQSQVAMTAELNRWRTQAARAEQQREVAERKGEELTQRLRELTHQLDQSTLLITELRHTVADAEARQLQQRMAAAVAAVGGEEPPPRGPPAGVDPSLLSVMKEELASAKAVNERLMAAHHTQAATVDGLRVQGEKERVELAQRLQEERRVGEERLRGVEEERRRWREEKGELERAMQALTADSAGRERLLVQLREQLQQRAKVDREALEQEEDEEEKYADVAVVLDKSASSTRSSPLIPQSPATPQPRPSSFSLVLTSPPPPPSPAPAPTPSELFTPALLDQLADRLAVKLSDRSIPHHVSPSRPPPFPPSPTTSRAKNGRGEAGGEGDSAKAIAAEMEAIYRQLEGKGRAFSKFAKRGRREQPDPQPPPSRSLLSGRGKEDGDFLPLIHHALGGAGSGGGQHSRPTSRSERPDRDTHGQQQKENEEEEVRRPPASTHRSQSVWSVEVASRKGKGEDARSPYPSYLHSPTSSLLSSPPSSPVAASSSPPVSPCSLSPVLSSSFASSARSGASSTRAIPVGGGVGGMGSGTVSASGYSLRQQQMRDRLVHRE